MSKVVYGTSSFTNPAEALLTAIVARKTGTKGMFFVYPRGEEWKDQDFQRLFEPENPPNQEEEREFYEALELEVKTLQEMVNSLPTMTMEEVAKKIREKREIKSFLAVRIAGQEKAVYVSSTKDKNWPTYAKKTVQEVVGDPKLKIGGAFIYYLTGLFCREMGYKFLIPHRPKADVLGAVWASGIESKEVVETGMLDVVTTKQYQEYQKEFKVAPPREVLKLWRKEEAKNRIEKELISKNVLVVVGNGSLAITEI